MNKIFLHHPAKTSIHNLFDLNQQKNVNFQKINGVWNLISEFGKKRFTQDELFKFLFHCKGIDPVTKRLYPIVFDRTGALPLVRKGYQILDEYLNSYLYKDGKYLRNGDELCDLPSTPNYIVMPFQVKIRGDEPVVTDNAHFVRSKDYNPERKPNRPLLDSSELKIAKYKIKTEEAEKTVVKLQQQLSTESKKKVKYAIGSSILGFVAGFVSDRCMKKFFSVDELYSYKYF